MIYRYHEDDDPALNWAIVWRGEVSGFSVSGRKAKIRIPSTFENALNSSMPDVFYQNPCNHILYDDRCKVVKATFTQVTDITVISANGLTITVTDDGFADAVLAAGDLFIPNKKEHRLMLSNVANVLTINFPFFNAEVGDQVQLFAGCDHAYQGHCKTKFANTVNFGGFPYVPSENPFEGTLS